MASGFPGLFTILKCIMWHTRGVIPYFLSVFAATFVQMGCFTLMQKILAGAYAGDRFYWACGLLQALFIFPYIALLLPASFFSNKFQKNRVMLWSSVAMTAVMAGIAVLYSLGFSNAAFWGVILLSSAFAVHSPAKYGILKEMFGTRNLSYSNAYLLIVSVAALFASSWIMIACFSAVRGIATGPSALFWVLAGVSALAAVSAAFIPAVGREDVHIRMRSVKHTVRATWANPVSRACIAGLAVLWGVAQVFVMVFQDTSASPVLSVLQNSLALAFAGLIVGGIVAARVSRDFIETGLIPMGALGASVSMFFIPFTSNPVGLAVLFALVGFFAGFFVVALQALLQFYTRPENSGRVLAMSNAIQMLVVAVFLGIYILLLNFTGVKTHHLFLALSVISFIGYALAIRKMPQALLRSLLRTFFSLYKLKVLGVQNIPDSGPVLLVGNHHSFIDWAVLQMASPRPLRIASNKDHFEKWYLRKILQRLGLIRIQRKDPAEAMTKIHEALLAGEAVAIFPEGEVSKSPHVGPFVLDYSEAVKGTDAVVIPFYIQGLWGSRYSHNNTANMFGPASTRIVTVAFGEALLAETPANDVRNAVREISIDAWAYSISFYRPLASSWLRASKKLVGFDPSIYSPDGNHYSGYRLIGGVLAASRIVKHRTHGEKNIGILLPPGPAGVISNLAVWVRRKVVVNLNYTSAPDVVAVCAEKAEVKTIFTSRVFIDKLKSKGKDFTSLEKHCKFIYMEDAFAGIPKYKLLLHLVLGVILPARLLEFIYFRHTKLSDTAAILFSSGSEGTPKGICLSHLNMMGNIEQTSCIVNMGRGDVMLAELPMFHSFGLTVTILLNLIEGTPIITIADPTDVKTMARVCAQYKATVLVGTPTFLRAFTVNRWVHPMCFEHIRMIIAGAEKMRPEMAEAFRLKFGKDVFEGYGCTETTPVASVGSPNVLLDDFLTMQVNNKPGSVGMPLPGTRFRIVNPETNEDLPAGEAGMVLIGGCQVMQGYLKDPERTRDVIVEKDGRRYYRTGDKGYLDADGFLTLVDRYSRFAKMGGEMISLGAVEIRINESKVLNGCDYLVTAIPDKVKGECIVLLYQGEKPSDEVLRELRKAGIPPLMVPGLAFSVEAVPKLGTGKSDFTTAKQLAQQLAQG